MKKIYAFPVQNKYQKLSLNESETYLVKCEEILSCIEKMNEHTYS